MRGFSFSPFCNKQFNVKPSSGRRRNVLPVKKEMEQHRNIMWAVDDTKASKLPLKSSGPNVLSIRPSVWGKSQCITSGENGHFNSLTDYFVS